MNTTQLIARLAQRLGISKAEAHRLLHAHLERIGHHLAAGDTVVLRGFGTFSVKRTSSHRGRLPDSAKTAIVPGHRRPHFRPSAKLKAEVQATGAPVEP